MKEWKAKLHDLTAIVPRGVMNFLITAFFMAGAYYLSRLLFQFGVENNSALVYVLAVTFVSWLTTGYFYGILASLFSSFCINYYFMYPYSAFSLSYAGYPVAMLSMTAIAIIICTLTSRIKLQALEAEQREQNTKALYELNERLNQEKNAIQLEAARETIRSNILRSVSHDLRTPLTAISGAAAVLLSSEEPRSEKDVSLLNDIKNDAEALTTMVENLLSITRIQDASVPLKKREEMLEEVAGDAVLTTRRRFPDANVQLDLSEDILFLPMEPADVALLLEESGPELMPLLYRLLPKETAAEVFVELEPESQEMLINGFSNTELKEVLDELYLDDAVDIVEEMPASVVIRILDKATPEMRKSINEILKYPEDSTGSIMNMEFLSLKKDMTVEDAFKRIRRIGGELETINILYVTDPTRRLLGVLSVRDLLLAEEDDLIEDIMDPNVVWVSTMDDKEDAAQALSKYGFLAMPVVDLENRLVGIVTVDDAMDVIEEETTEDFEKMAAMLPSDKPYLKAGIFATWRARLPWLMILMLSATFTGMILNHYESALAACLVLNSYIPMLSGTGGNSGTQASVAVIRALSLDEVDFSDILKVLWKELRVSLLCGSCLAAANFVKMQLVDRLLLGNAAVTPVVCLVVCLTIMFVVVFAKCVGCSLPLLAEKIGLDPAVMASPFITTIVDATSLLIYFRFASWLLGI